MNEQTVEQPSSEVAPSDDATFAIEESRRAEAANEPSPSEGPRSASEADRELMQRGLAEMAKKEDATDFIDEFRDQKAWKEGDPKADNPYRKRAREDRLAPIVEQMRQEAYEALLVEPDVVEARIEDARRRAMFEVRRDQYERDNPGFIENVKTVAEMYGDISNLAASVIHESEHGPAIIDQLYRNPDAIAQLNQMPPRELDKFVAKMEGIIEAMGDDFRRPHTPVPTAPEPKLVSTAPKPVTTVSGKSSSPAKRSLHELAGSEDATAFIEESRRRERARVR